MIQFQIFAGLHTASGDCCPETVNRNRDTLRWVADTYLPGYTWQDCIGRWNRRNEPSVTLTFIGEQTDAESVQMIAGRYKELAQQESVLITRQQIKAGFV